MRWRGRSARPEEVAERLTRRGLFRVDGDSASLSDRETVRRWLHELRPERHQQVVVHRHWGTIAAVADRRHPVTVVMSDGEKSWFATAPGTPDRQELTPDQVTHILLDALTADSRPQWPDWHYLV